MPGGRLGLGAGCLGLELILTPEGMLGLGPGEGLWPPFSLLRLTPGGRFGLGPRGPAPFGVCGLA